MSSFILLFWGEPANYSCGWRPVTAAVPILSFLHIHIMTLNLVQPVLLMLVVKPLLLMGLSIVVQLIEGPIPHSAKFAWAPEFLSCSAYPHTFPM